MDNKVGKGNLTQRQIDALIAVQNAYARLAEVWEQDGNEYMIDTFSEADWLPNLDLTEACFALGDVIDNELESERFWIDTRNDQGEYLWIYKEVKETVFNVRTVFNVLGVSMRDEGTQDLTEISKQQYEAIESLWYGFNIDEDSPADHPNRDKSIQFEQDVLDVIANPNASIAEIHRMREYYGNDNV